jgi:hypothetical protein
LNESPILVEASRERRLQETFPRLSAEERQAILRAFHPDYIADAFQTLRIGPNQGDRTPRELAAALEGAPLLSQDSLQGLEPDASVDVLVIGGGGAGASAALLARENGARVLLTTKLRFGDANTMMAQGGIQAADKENDSPAIHYPDVVWRNFSNDPTWSARWSQTFPGDRRLNPRRHVRQGAGRHPAHNPRRRYQLQRMHAARDYTERDHAHPGMRCARTARIAAGDPGLGVPPGDRFS